MIYYDFHQEIADIQAAIRQAKLLGFSGMAVAGADKTMKDEKLREGFDLVSMVILKPKNPEELNIELERSRKAFEIIAVQGGDYEVNRSACEDNRVDLLLNPERGRLDSGIDHICAKAAADNSVAIEINFNGILNAKNRPRMVYFLKRNVYLCKKYNAPLITTSGASNIWEMRAPRELAAISHVLGMEINEAIESVSLVPEEKLKINRDKLSGLRFGEVKIVE
jgi:ribonuclease P/MRP protein subunit RPP1